MGLIGFVLGTILHDIPTVLLPTESFARRPTMWMQAMHDYGGTITFAPNFAFSLAVKRSRDKDLEGLDLSKVRVAGCGAEPINPQVMRAFAQHFGKVGFKAEALMPAYGMAEATLAISFHPHETAMITDRVAARAMRLGKAAAASDDEESLELVSCGPAFPGHEVKILGESGQALPERAVGEIVIKDLIIIRGANFYPQDIEWTVAEVEGVRRDNVVAFSVMEDGEEKLVVAAEANSGDAPELRKAIATKVSETHGLTAGYVAIVRVGSLPKTSSGKVQRRRTKQLFEDGQLEEHPS
jgi:fatty-acyl-CoA synthase